MPTPQREKQLHPLCREHHGEMKLIDLLLHAEGLAGGASAYACPEPDCIVHYHPVNGYFIAAKNGLAESDMTPRVKCIRDGRPMYLAQINPEKRAFRLWRCPRCEASHSNEDEQVDHGV